jgi:hypothetical protein
MMRIKLIATSSVLALFANGLAWAQGGVPLRASTPFVPFGGVSKVSLVLGPGWTPFGPGHASATATKAGTVVYVSGLIKNSSKAWGHLATLPIGFRPSSHLVFNVSGGQSSARVDVLPDGRIMWVAGGRDYGWLTLAGITFSVGSGATVPLARGWTNFGEGYSPAFSHKLGDFVLLTGLVRTDGRSWGEIARLPAGLAPEKQLVFQANNQNRGARVDVLPDGRVVWVAGGRESPFLSLSGLIYYVGGGQPLALAKEWTNFGAPYRAASFAKSGNVVHLSGLIKTSGKAWGKIATLPPGFRPPDRLIFNVDTHGQSSRIDVLPDGQVIWICGKTSSGWMSLSGIHFVAQ